jgi:hypothetical protein
LKGNIIRSVEFRKSGARLNWESMPQLRRWLQGVLIATGSLGFSTLILASAVAWGPQREKCQLSFPSIIGCAVGSYENLSGGLLAASAALFAGWMAWTAVQLQMSAEERRATADRLEAERLLLSDMDWIAETLAAMWKVLEAADANIYRESSPKLQELRQQIDAVVVSRSSRANPGSSQREICRGDWAGKNVEYTSNCLRLWSGFEKMIALKNSICRVSGT